LRPIVRFALSILFPVYAVAASTDAIRKTLGEFRAVKTGVDAAGTFWAWDDEGRSITAVSPSGTRVSADELPAASMVDADLARGILALTSSRAVTILNWSGQTVRLIPLDQEVSNVAWLGGDEFAVATSYASDLIEIWSAKTGRLLRRLVSVPVILKPARGAVFARTTLLRYDVGRKLLIAIDAVTGEVRVVRSDGQLVTTAKLPEDPALRVWLASVDAEARKSGKTATPSMWRYAAATVDDDGVVWVGEGYDDQSVRVARIPETGRVEHLTLATPCPNIRLDIWQHNFIFYQVSRSPRPQCVGVRRQ